jgi:hypothetical protein
VQAERAKLRAAQDTTKARPTLRAAEPVERRIQSLLDKLDAGDEAARAVMEQMFPHGIWLEPSPCGKYLIALLGSDGVGLLLYDGWREEALAAFRVENSMVAGAGLRRAYSQRLPYRPCAARWVNGRPFARAVTGCRWPALARAYLV